MRDRATLLKLAADVEAADGPDRELDARVWVALHGGEIIALQPGYVQSGDWSAVGFTQAYTDSVDAALALMADVLPGWGYTLIKGADGKDRGYHGREAIITPPMLTDDEYATSAATVPLAIVAAVLRAVADSSTPTDHPKEL